MQPAVGGGASRKQGWHRSEGPGRGATAWSEAGRPPARPQAGTSPPSPRSQLGRGHTGSQSPCCTGEWHGRVRVPRLGAGAGPGAGTVQGPLQVARLSQGGGHQRGAGHQRHDCGCR